MFKSERPSAPVYYYNAELDRGFSDNRGGGRGRVDARLCRVHEGEEIYCARAFSR